MIYKRHIDVEKNLVFIDELECVSMDLSRLPEELLFYLEIDENDWTLTWRNFNDSHGLMTFLLPIQKIALQILDEAVILWEQQRGLKFNPDIHKGYREEIEEIERLANEQLGLELEE